MESDCSKNPPLELLRAVEQFNAGEYYECHESLEDLWRGEPGKIRDLYKGILQIAVALHHAKRSNVKGALRLISSGMELTRQFAPRCLGIDTGLVIEMAGRIKEELEKLDPEQNLSSAFIPKIRLTQ
jgi:predicted metal-dependent hydrolase